MIALPWWLFIIIMSEMIIMQRWWSCWGARAHAQHRHSVVVDGSHLHGAPVCELMIICEISLIEFLHREIPQRSANNCNLNWVFCAISALFQLLFLLFADRKVKRRRKFHQTPSKSNKNRAEAEKKVAKDSESENCFRSFLLSPPLSPSPISPSCTSSPLRWFKLNKLQLCKLRRNF